MKKLWIIVSIICLVAISLALVNIYAIPKYLQVQHLAPDIEKYQDNKNSATEIYIKDNISINSKIAGANAKLRAVDYEYFNTYFARLVEGRLFYSKEISNVAILDRPLAQKLFPSVSAIEKDIDIDGVSYKVVGVIDKSPYTMYSKNAYIPVFYAQKLKMKPKLQIETIDTAVNSRSEFLEGASYDGIWDIVKEREKSLLLFKISVYIILAMLAIKCLRILKLKLKNDYSYLKMLNQNKYPGQYMLQILFFIFKAVIGYAVIAIVMALGLYHLVDSIIKIPEYIPEILVDFNMIYDRFVENIKADSNLFYVRTDAMISLWHLASVINSVFVLALLATISTIFHERKNKHD